MNDQTRMFWASSLMGVVAGILTYLMTQYFDVAIAIAVMLAAAFLVAYLLLADRIAELRSKRSRQSRAQAIKKLEQEMAEIAQLHNDIPKLIARVAVDMLVFQVTLVLAVLVTILMLIIIPVIGSRPDLMGAVLVGFAVGMTNQFMGFRYIQRLSDFENYKSRAQERLEKLRRPMWLDILLTRDWVLVHNPPHGFKRITFLTDGRVGEGRNQNENTWRIKDELLELVQEDGRTHSLFEFDSRLRRFDNTNDPDTPSNRNQYIHLAPSKK